ncbi:UDP-N-acetylmuramyl peptide synthase [Bifidobacterium panos]|uniref:UDP-N-acetylmuramyl peptide synthase n=1 Tax=Bifidobacterium panos TaxID=2675321 RepID=A0ABX1SV32_9BIFI|nr:UDP-N-acetylmuramyl peptide synthase [Bifidobacterium sp. DSM 109963]NMN01683.1 UDP-N-acetylmuramyl peptide synthase [Bifidobacterium sp. DSM 109963]
MSAVSESITRRTTLGDLTERYGWELVPSFATGVTVTSLADNLDSIVPGALVAFGDKANAQTLYRARCRGAYAAVVSPAVREMLPADFDLPLLIGEMGARQLGQLACLMAGEPSSSLAVFAVCGNQSTQVAEQLARCLHMLGNPVGLLSVDGSYSLERTLNLAYPLNALDMQQCLAVCCEDGAAAAVIALDGQTVALEGLQAVSIDVLGSLQPAPPRADQAYIERLQNEYGFLFDDKMRLTICTEESNTLARVAAKSLDPLDERHLSLAISMMLAAGVRRSSIRNALRVSDDLH